MSSPTQLFRVSLLALGATALIVGCTAQPQPQTPQTGDSPPTQVVPEPAANPGETDVPDGPAPDPTPTPMTPGTSASPNPDGEGETAVTGTIVDDPTSITVLVNKEYALPADYVPSDLVEPNVRFIFAEQDEKRLMRAEAARALEAMFTAAEQDGIYLAGVSGYRSFETQDALFAYYVSTDGLESAQRYSAEPGHSEHQTGLTMDVSGSTGACAAEDCFAGTPEAEWLARHAHEHGFIIRYPEGKESITGYAYEPWHVRYVGKELAREIHERGITLEEYFSQAE